MLKTLSKHITREAQAILAMTLIIWGGALLIRALLIFISETMTWEVSSKIIPLGFLVTFMLWAVLHKLRFTHFFIIILLSQPIAMLADTLHSELYYLVTEHTFSWIASPTTWKETLYSTYLGSLTFLAWYLGYFTIIYYFRFQRETLSAIEARGQAHQAQLQMLRYQLNPHFLFNTLNSISALVLDDRNANAESMIGSLSRFLRFSLDETQDLKIPLHDELNVIREYLEIEKIRFSDKLDVEFNISETAKNCLVPSLILQPAIENAIKHAIAPLKRGGKITITAYVKKNTLHISIVDNGPGLSEHKNTIGVGVQNMRERLKVMYENTAQLDVSNTDAGGVSVTFSLPAETSQIQKGFSV